MWYYFIVAFFTILAVALVWAVAMYIQHRIRSSARKDVLRDTVLQVLEYDLQHFDNRKPLHEFFPEDFRFSYLQRKELEYCERLYDTLFQEHFAKLEKLAMQNTLLQTLEEHQQQKRAELPARRTMYDPTESA